MKVSVVCVGIQTLGNLGGIARLCFNFQIEHLILINPKCRIQDKITYQRAVGGASYLDNAIKLDKLEKTRDYVDYMIALTGVIAKTMTRNPLSIIKVANNLSAFKDSHIAIVLGPEDVGLTNNELSVCDISATIPLEGEEKSSKILNITQAAGIALYELNREKVTSDMTLIPTQVKKNILNYFEDLIQHDKFNDVERYNARLVFSNLISQSFLSGKDVYGLPKLMKKISAGFVKSKEVQ